MRFCQIHFELQPAPGIFAIKCAPAVTDQRVRARRRASAARGVAPGAFLDEVK